MRASISRRTEVHIRSGGALSIWQPTLRPFPCQEYVPGSLFCGISASRSLAWDTCVSNFVGSSDHDPKTIVILDNTASDEQALKSLTDDACLEFRKYGLPPPSVPRPLANYVPCRVLIQTYKDPGGRRRGCIQFIRPTGVLGYDEEWMI